ncbi:MAG TPA: GntR family transcriptional regulator [Anaerolineales bacterium]|nr:GntR family transcriptional regulator [Anaerolineales bacterium]HNE03674.1 GntR family transcriptional regulator [Anaerolineales bacterium]HNF93265.1 GntR family transcriptional regulator [Anaerolineales bacterium]HNM35717.1 GntR family transcriptional regulator [Anaerolineales bacterium]
MNSDSHRQLRNVVADKMRAAILDGQYKPGEWLRQERLAQELGVSQMPVREALNELVNEGLIEHVPYRGARVIQFSIEDVIDLYEHRAFLEGRAAYFAAQIITDRDLTALKKIQVGMEENDAPEAVLKYRDLNRNFHKTIFTISKHKYLIRTLNQMWAAFPTMLIGNFAATASHPLPARDDTDRQEHQAIMDALFAHDGTSAEQAMRNHILATREQLVSFLKANQ